jgi:hypothetical protein
MSNRTNNSFNDLNNSDLLFINILNTIYNDNLRIINQLIEQNSEITRTLTNLMNDIRTTNSRNIFNNNLNQQTNVSSNDNNINTNLNDRRIYIDNIPYYIVDEIQFFTIPNANTNVNSNENANENANTNNNTNNNTNINANANLNNTNRRPLRTTRNRLSQRYNNDMHTFMRENSEPILPTSLIGRGHSILNSFFQPINVVPTQTQIENATSNVIYRDIINPINASCPISLETFTETSHVTMIKHCKHIFNTQNLMSWFNSNCKCPVCRYDIREYTDNENNNSVSDEENNNSNNSNVNTNVDNDENNNSNNSNVNTNVDNDENNDIQNNFRLLRNQTANIFENLLYETMYDLSNNNINYSDDISPLLTLLFQNGRYYNSNSRR